MKVTISNILFDGIRFDREYVNVPTDLRPVKDWLDDYNLKYTDDDDVRKVYIRIALFQRFDMSCTIIKKYIPTSPDFNKKQRYAIDIFDQKYESFETVKVNFEWPETFSCTLTEDDLIDYEKDKIESLDLAIYDYLCHYLPVKITFL